MRTGQRVLGAGLLVASGAIHLDLYLTGYRTIPTIGAMFLVQIVASFVVGITVLVRKDRAVAAAGALLAIATLAGYLLSLRVGLFGFREVSTTAGIVAGALEIGAFAILGEYASRPADSSDRPSDHLVGWLGAGSVGVLRGARVAVLAASVAGALLLGLSATSASSPLATARHGHAVLDETTIGGAAVLTTAQGLTAYWFAPDTPTSSACSGTCTIYWPPVIGTPRAGTGVTGSLGTLRRSDGTVQATYDGHPLYTYIGDSARGQDSGNGIDLNGGVWHEVLVGA